jgi:tetratricopeptide (TPR) repeat protein
MREAMEIARLARRNEDYDRALSALDRAMRIADEEKDTPSVTVIGLHQADILIEQGEYTEAEQLLQTVQQTAEAVNQPGFTAYALVSMGMLCQERGEWDNAREQYEQAREIAAEANAEGAEGRALGHLADVYLHEQNASYAVHLLQESLPKLNAAGDLEMSSYFVGRLGQAMMATGQETEGYQLLDRALRLGEQMRDKKMIRYWSSAIGEAAYNQHRYQEAYTYYKRALPLFNAKPSAAYIDALTHTSRTCLALGEREEALVYAEQATQVTQDSDDEALQAAAAGALGIALRANGRHEEAVTHLEAAVNAEAVEANIDLLRQLAAAYAAVGNVDAAEHTYQRALSQAGHSRVQGAKVQRDLGLFYAERGKLSAAIDIWSKALSAFEEESQHDQVARLHCDIASARRQLGQGQRAIRDYEQALILLNNVDDMATRGLVLSNTANAYADQGDTESADAFFEEAVDIARKIEDDDAEATRLGNHGWFMVATGKPRKGIEMLTEALKISEARGLHLQAAVQTDNMGLAYDALSQYKTALEYHEKALAMLDAVEEPALRWQAVFTANTAKTKLALGRVDEADTLFDEAVKLARQSGDYEAVTTALTGKARALLSQSKPEDAEPLLAEAIQIARKTDMRRLLAEALAVQSEQQAAQDKDERARQLWDEAKRLYQMVGSPQAKQTPFWLGTTPPDNIESSS